MHRGGNGCGGGLLYRLLVLAVGGLLGIWCTCWDQEAIFPRLGEAGILEGVLLNAPL